MSETAIIILYLTDIVFLTTNILLLHIFLTPKRPYWFQAIAFIATGITVHWLRIVLEPVVANFLLRGFITGPLYLIPCTLLFKETLHARIFVFFLIYSLTQFTYLIFIHIDRFLSPPIPDIFVIVGLFLEFLSLPFISKYAAPHIKDIIGIINQQHPSFTLYPVFSFILLAFYSVQGIYLLATFIPIVLSTILIFFTYYLIAIAIDQTKRQQQLENQRDVNDKLTRAQELLEALNQQLDFTSRTDSLTGLYNRRHMEQRIKEEYEQYQRTGSEFALVIGDIDFFKKVNDMYGHDCGDCLLTLLSEEFRKSVRAYDTVARWGGDEFLLLLPATNEENAVGLAERIIKTVEDYRYVYENETLSVTLTLGISVIRQGDTIASIIKKADLALYHGKRAGGNCVTSFDGITNREIPEIS